MLLAMMLRRRQYNWDKPHCKSSPSRGRTGSIAIVVSQHALLWSSCYVIGTTIYLTTVLAIDAMVLPALTLMTISVG